MVQRHPMRDPTPSVVACDVKAVRPQRSHQVDHVLRHLALGIGDVVRAAIGLVAVAVAAQVRRDDREITCERRGDLTPGHMGLWMSVQEKERLSPPCDGEADPWACVGRIIVQREPLQEGRGTDVSEKRHDAPLCKPSVGCEMPSLEGQNLGAPFQTLADRIEILQQRGRRIELTSNAHLPVVRDGPDRSKDEAQLTIRLPGQGLEPL